MQERRIQIITVTTNTNWAGVSSLGLESVNRAEVDSAVTVGTGLENREFLIVISTPTWGSAHLEVSEDLEPARFKRVEREKRGIDILSILNCRICVGEAKQV